MSRHPTRRRGRCLRNHLKAVAYECLAYIDDGLSRPVTVTAHDRDYLVTLTVQPAGTAAGASAAPPGLAGALFLSPVEAAVVNALTAAAGQPLSGKQLAAKCFQDYDTKFKYILQNLEERRVIHLEPSVGYRLGGRPAA